VLGVSVGASLVFPRREPELALAEATAPAAGELLNAREGLRHAGQDVAEATGD
jgi:hypothetical protein